LIRTGSAAAARAHYLQLGEGRASLNAYTNNGTAYSLLQAACVLHVMDAQKLAVYCRKEGARLLKLFIAQTSSGARGIWLEERMELLPIIAAVQSAAAARRSVCCRCWRDARQGVRRDARGRGYDASGQGDCSHLLLRSLW
jgi:hypothetical protein